MAGETRQKILEAAERLIFLKGLGRVTTKDLARETGLSEGALYRHFERKDEIFFAVIAQHLPTFLDAFRAHLPGTESVQSNLTAILLAAMDYFAKLIPMAAAFLADAELLAQYRQRMSRLATESNHEGPQAIENLMVTYLEEEKELGRLQSPILPPKLALFLLHSCFHFTYMHQLMGAFPYGLTREQFIDDLLEGLLLV